MSHPLETVPREWAQYRAHLTPLTGKEQLARAVGARVNNDDTYLGYLDIFKELNVGFFEYSEPRFLSYHVVQLGDGIPDCERLIAWRAVSAGQAAGDWYSPLEHAIGYVDGETILDQLFLERQQRRILNRLQPPTVASNQAWWQAHILTNQRNTVWATIAHRLQAMHDNGHDWQAIHDLLHHHDVWLTANPEFAGMPRELVLRVHGLGAVLHTEYWLKVQASAQI